MTAVRGTSLAWLLLAATIADARAVDLAECARIDDAVARLACFDRLSGRAPASTSAPASQAAQPMGDAAPPPVVPSDAVADRASADRVDAAAAGSGTAPSLLGERWALDAAPRNTRYAIRYHNTNYFIGRNTDRLNGEPASPTHPSPADTDPAALNPAEAKFQISFKGRLWESDDRRFAMWAAYTQQSHWQIGNARLSRPFRETDYQPELILAFRPDLELAGVRWRLLNAGLAHQSNGREDPQSRSWNRLYAQFGIERGDFALLLRAWHRLPENAQHDDNPDLTHYVGHGDAVALYRRNGHTFTLTARGAGAGRGAVQFEWSTPPLIGPLKGYLQVFSGYGESLIDYNWRQNTIGIGFSLNDIL